MFGGVYKGRRVLVTGHTGFKGSYLALFCSELGAELCGVALPMPEPNHFDLLKLDMRSEMCDIRDSGRLTEIFASFRPEIVFHLAAQPLVRLSYGEPIETFDINVMGTLKVLDCCRHTSSCRAAVVVTSDKCYENSGSGRAFVEDDPMGGFDPYSASKGCAELATASFRRSFCLAGGLLVASARAGNVIGGGDWAPDRLVPDLMRGAASNETVILRNPRFTRPWQHVLEPLSGYLALGARLLDGDASCASGWNFGPENEESISVERAACEMARYWDRIRFECRSDSSAPHEAEHLRLDSSKARRGLSWRGVWDAGETFSHTVLHYRDFCEKGKLNTRADLKSYCDAARRKGLPWAK